jgi:hypothetical protein
MCYPSESFAEGDRRESHLGRPTGVPLVRNALIKCSAASDNKNFVLVTAEVHGSTSAGGATKAEACQKPRCGMKIEIESLLSLDSGQGDSLYKGSLYKEKYDDHRQTHLNSTGHESGPG